MPVLQLAQQTNRQQRRAEARRKPLRPAPIVRTSPKPRIDASAAPVLPAAKLLPEHMVLLDLYGQPPVAFHRVLVDIAGSVTAALWLSHAVAMVQQEMSGEGGERTFTLTQEACHQATGLTRREQETARARLRDMGLLTEARRGRQIACRLDLPELARRLLAHSAEAWSVLPASQSASATGTHS
jgi:hypothetical protein